MTKKLSTETRKAKQVTHNPWRDRRVLFGMAVVLTSAVIGGGLWIITTSTSTYWAVSSDVKAGELVTANQLRRVEVNVPSDIQRTLVAASGAQPTGAWAHDLTAGSLVTRGAIGDREPEGQRLPLKVSVGALPASLTTGDVVNIWVGPNADSQLSSHSEKAKRILTEVRVVSVSPDVGAAERTVLVDVGFNGPTPEVVAAISEQHLTVVFVR